MDKALMEALRNPRFDSPTNQAVPFCYLSTPPLFIYLRVLIRYTIHTIFLHNHLLISNNNLQMKNIFYFS